MRLKKISLLPSPPNRTKPNFAKKADKFLAALPKFVFQMNELIDAINERDDKKAAALEEAKKLIITEVCLSQQKKRLSNRKGVILSEEAKRKNIRGT